MTGEEPYLGLNGFDPYAYMEQWIEDHPECLRPYWEALRRRGGSDPKMKRYGGTDNGTKRVRE
ncbi:hypothetical protein SEA_OLYMPICHELADO_61 [Streptomyces phage OlympicHelado]|uniref:Uncharacterized protein n=1 Tax=Streptomyces phage OlympicHelado TaxID=1897524 RepID=A0A1I9SDJ9_9CAUD|nr:hypothetical protein SEA_OLYMPICHELADO_61 [Streptomyces phage OlympicHelado]